MSNGFVPKPRVKNALDNTKLQLKAPTPGCPGKTAALIWGLIANNPRITVFTNDPSEESESKGYGKISANLDLPTFMVFLNLINKSIASPTECKFKIENKNFTFFGGKRSEKPAVVSELHAGRDADGMIWISVTAPSNQNRPRIRFYFQLSDYHCLVNGDGTPFSAAETSLMAAKGYVDLLSEMMTNMAANNYVEPPVKDGAKKPYGGQAPAAADGDLPF